MRFASSRRRFVSSSARRHSLPDVLLCTHRSTRRAKSVTTKDNMVLDTLPLVSTIGLVVGKLQWDRLDEENDTNNTRMNHIEHDCMTVEMNSSGLQPTDYVHRKILGNRSLRMGSSD